MVFSLSRKGGWKIALVLLLVCGLLSEIFSTGVFLFGDDPRWVFLFHAGGIFFLVSAFVFSKKFISPRAGLTPLFIYALTLAALMPVVGWGTALICVACVWGFGRRLKQGIYEDYEEFLSETEGQSETTGRLIGDLRQLREEVSFESFIDIVHGTNIALKTKVIAKLSEMMSAQNVQLLKEALKDPAAEIRLYAATALLKLERKLNTKIKNALTSVQREGSAASYAELGRLYALYASIDLVDESLSKHYLQQAYHAYESSLDLETDQRDTVIAYAYVLFELGRVERAHRLLQKAFALWPGDRHIALLKNRIDFQLGRFQLLKPALTGSDVSGLSPEEKLAADFWMGDAQV